MAIYELNGISPRIAPGVWIADSADVIGDVVIGEGSSIWFGAVLRGDNATLTIGSGTSIQDGSILHADEGVPLTVGNHVTIGHRVVLHGCTVGDGALIGIGAMVLNGARIGARSLVGAGALVTEGKEMPDDHMVLGVPGKAIKPLSPEQLDGLGKSAEDYIQNARRFAAGLIRRG
ncbi:gamma carbonic anhydrase family protein [Cupriavidus nantongensis]|uniref:Gamma carbonic anhydrase family protein n=1 Tax=Cupriavidus nantongensis TaxID=1796606 RepID=A0A142JR26_9BURK|nr:gamma carbonic anhydrase family protein [Cupriavidus nantongensis]AMR80538.1 gamma carbonic anhydrase family protein [Cupriavidus nantongensis]